MRALRLVAAAAALTLVALSAQVGVALAHSPDVWFTERWSNGAKVTPSGATVSTDRNVNWNFVAAGEPEGFPSGDGGRNAVRAAAERWNNQGQTLRFVENGGADWDTYEWNWPCSWSAASYQQNKVAWEPIDGANGTLGQASWCSFTQPGTSIEVIHNFKMRFDKAETWFKSDSSTAVPSNATDMYGIAVHEFGHAAGFSGANTHWNGTSGTPISSSLCNSPAEGPDHHTMCRSIAKGAYGWRSLEPHDIDTFALAY